MFSRILIANRGEIACRIIRTCQKLGVETVAVSSLADAGQLHTRMADQVVMLESYEAKDSYLNITAIVEGAQESGTEAIHPGYGFLAESSEFARAVEKSGLTFIGPSPETMDLLGDKVAARQLAIASKVPIVPGIELASGKKKSKQLSPTQLKKIRELGFPILVKAAAGGGGRGMRIVGSETDLQSAIESAMREAESFFGDGTVFIEKHVQNARHIEVQIIGDSSKTIRHLGDRDCSLQRHHQKIIEEAPATAGAIQEKLREAAVRIGQAAGYTGAGTVEFLVEPEEGFYFLEVNARLQVEHPVTEMITGIDLVELQLRIAAGDTLKQCLPEETAVSENTHAIECRICAEVPEENFRAATGQLLSFDLPPCDGVRLDSGFVQGDRVSHFYDSLLAKLIVTRRTRSEAIAGALEALGKMQLFGLQTNIPFLLALLSSDAFKNNLHTTRFVEQNLALLLDDRCDPLLNAGLAVAALRTPFLQSGSDESCGWNVYDGWRMHGSSQKEYLATVSGETLRFQARVLGEEILITPTEGEPRSIFVKNLVRESRCFDFRAEIGAATCRYLVAGDSEVWLNTGSGPVHVHFEYPCEFSATAVGANLPGIITSPLPGKIIEVLAGPGDTVSSGTTVLVVESMKMEHPLPAPLDAQIEKVHVQVGDLVEAGSPLITLAAC